MQKEFDMLGFKSFTVSDPETRKMLGTVLLPLSQPEPEPLPSTPEKQHGLLMSAVFILAFICIFLNRKYCPPYLHDLMYYLSTTTE
jgi:hypothetical protein